MNCSSPVTVKVDGVERVFPCGHCLHCRIQHSREWATRLLHELNYYDESAFVTLTYDDEHIPEDFALHKEELQNFFKLLRRDLGNKKIKHFSCGEYGDTEKKYSSPGCPTLHGRPHFHSIIFGLSGKDKELIYENWQRCAFERLDVGTVTYDSCRYVADYVLKKYNGDKQRQVYGEIQPPFQTCSQGIGKRFALDNSDYIRDNMYFYIHGVKVSVPRYYLKVLGIKPEKDYRQEFDNLSRLVAQAGDDFNIYAPMFIHHGAAQTAYNVLESKGMLKQKDDTLRAKLNLYLKEL